MDPTQTGRRVFEIDLTSAIGMAIVQYESGTLRQDHAVVAAKKKVADGRRSVVRVGALSMRMLRRETGGSVWQMTGTRRQILWRTHHVGMEQAVVGLSGRGNGKSNKETAMARGLRATAGGIVIASVSAIGNGLEAAASKTV